MSVVKAFCSRNAYNLMHIVLYICEFWSNIAIINQIYSMVYFDNLFYFAILESFAVLVNLAYFEDSQSTVQSLTSGLQCLVFFTTLF